MSNRKNGLRYGAGITIVLIIALLTEFLLLNRGYFFQSSRQPVTPPPQSHDSTAKDSQPNPLTCVSSLPLAQRIGQKLMAAGYNTQITDETSVFANFHLGGMIVMDEIPADRIASFRNAMAIAPFIAVDQEGGTVQRYKGGGLLPGAEQMADTVAADIAYQQYLADGRYLKNQGITVNFAPVVDVISHTPNPLPGRMYSTNPQAVIEYAGAAIRAMKDAGLIPVIKHFPGLGSASANTDFSPTVTDPLSILRSRDLLPYEKLASPTPDVMVGNMIVPELTNDQPAVWSVEAINLLRNMGYGKAVIYSDSLTAEAIPGNLSDAVIKAWQAGIDVALVVQDTADTAALSSYLQTIASSAESALQSGTLGSRKFDESVLRILNRKQLDPCTLVR